MVVGGKTPILDLSELQARFAIVLYANVALQAAVHGMQAALRQLKDNGRLDEMGPVASFRERQRLVRKADYDALEKRYATREDAGRRGPALGSANRYTSENTRRAASSWGTPWVVSSR